MVSDGKKTLEQLRQRSLNPCCNGIWSQTDEDGTYLKLVEGCLNPCCNGIWSQTARSAKSNVYSVTVLILVVMEYGLRHMGQTQRRGLSCVVVLILVVMEYGLRLETAMRGQQRLTCLNPCCNGIWSRTL